MADLRDTVVLIAGGKAGHAVFFCIHPHGTELEDLKIMLATVKILFMPESTEGVAEGQTTAMGDTNK